MPNRVRNALAHCTLPDVLAVACTSGSRAGKASVAAPVETATRFTPVTPSPAATQSIAASPASTATPSPSPVTPSLTPVATARMVRV
jgi:hypothetical protein